LKSGSGIVIEVTNKKATLLMKDGTFVTVRIPTGKHPSVGKEYQTSYFSQRKRSLFVVPSLSLSVAALIAFVLLSGLFPTGSGSAAAAYVSFDINPSLEVGVDEEMQIVQIDTFNDEAKKIIKKYDLDIEKKYSFEEFADQLIKAYEKEGYMKSDHAMLITTISRKEGNDKTEAALDQALDSIVKKTVVKYPVRITVSESNIDTREKAKHLGVSSGKYSAFQKANKNGIPLKEEKIKEINFQELKVTAVSSNDLKSLPHPRKIKTEPKHGKKDMKVSEPKNEIKKQNNDKKHRDNDHDHKNPHKKVLEELEKPKEIKIIKGNNHPQNRSGNNNQKKNQNNHRNKQQDRNKHKHPDRIKQQDWNKQQERNKHKH
jgi:hypothetical protein